MQKALQQLVRLGFFTPKYYCKYSDTLCVNIPHLQQQCDMPTCTYIFWLYTNMYIYLLIISIPCSDRFLEAKVLSRDELLKVTYITYFCNKWLYIDHLSHDAGRNGHCITECSGLEWRFKKTPSITVWCNLISIHLQTMATPNFILPPGVTVPRSLVPISAPSSTLIDVESFLMSQCCLAHDVLPDGNCMFRALSHQLYGSDQHHVQVRSMLLEVIESNKIIYQPYWIEDMPWGKTRFNEHLQRVALVGSWVLK